MKKAIRNDHSNHEEDESAMLLPKLAKFFAKF